MYLINRIPFARGPAVSAATFLAYLANLADKPSTVREILNITAEMEGHPDNAAPAI